MTRAAVHTFVSGFLLMLMLPGFSGAQDAKLIEAAKKEGGKVVVYGSIENDTMDLISAAFKKKTGLAVDFWRSSATKVMDRVVSESRAGKPLYDVALTNSAPMDFMYNEGALMKYDSPSANAFRPPKGCRRPRTDGALVRSSFRRCDFCSRLRFCLSTSWSWATSISRRPRR